MRRTLMASVLAVILSACSAGAAVVGPSPGTLTGHVQVRACGGANRADQSGCELRPYAGGALEFQLTPPTGKGSDRLVVSDANGRYTIVLPPGIWTVTAMASATSQQLPRVPAFPAGQGGPRQVTVTAGKTVTADFVYTIQLL